MTGFQQYGYTPSGSGAGTYDASAASTEDHSIWDSAFGNSGQFLGGVANIIAATKGGSYQQYGNMPVVQPATSTGPNMWLIIGGLLLVVLLYFFFIKKVK